MDNLNLMGNGNAVNNEANVIETLKQKENSAKTSMSNELLGISSLIDALPEGQYQTRFENDSAIKRLNVVEDSLANEALDFTVHTSTFTDTTGNPKSGVKVKDENKLNNRISNLELVTRPLQNAPPLVAELLIKVQFTAEPLSIAPPLYFAELLIKVQFTA